MNARQFGQLLRLGGTLPAQLRRPVTAAQALTQLREQLASRERNFLTAAASLIYGNPTSPYRQLLQWAGCDWEDLRRGVEAHGLEPTLEQLRGSGVYLTLEEFKGQAPIFRPGLTLAPRAADFGSPRLGGSGIRGSSSGSRARPSGVMYTWPFIADEAAHELVLYGHHGVLDAPLALWYPAPPAVAGVHNLVMSLKLGHAPARWFSQLNPAHSGMPPWHRWSLGGIRWGGWLAGMRVPTPEFADFAHADRVLDWMQQALHAHASCVLRTFASSAVRLAECAQQRGVGLGGATIFTGGEPLTDVRRQFIESAGARVYPRYVATESGLIGGACANRTTTDDMHVYIDRVAVIPSPDGLLMSTLSPHSGQVLLNTNLGDTGELATRTCDCVLGHMGFDVHLARVRSQQRVTMEGMTVMVAELERIIGRIVARAGGGPDSFQCRQVRDERGISRLVIAISPGVPGLSAQAVLEAIHGGLQRQGGGAAIAGAVWKQAGSLQVVREQPQLSPGSKLPPLVSRE
jgi:hypothetical protein